MQTLPWDVGEDFNIGLGVIDGWDWEAQGQRLPPRVITSTQRVRLFDQGTAVQLAEVKGGEIITPRRIFSLATAATPVNVNLDNQVELLGYHLRPTSPSADDAIHLTLYWRATADVDLDYTVFTHLIDEGGTIVAQHDGQPDGGSYPTSEWLEGEVVEDEHTLVPATKYGSGEYSLAVGMYHLESGERLPAYDQNGVSLPQSRIVLTKVQVRE
jgi:phytoene dehydrogenase-like protein